MDITCLAQCSYRYGYDGLKHCSSFICCCRPLSNQIFKSLWHPFWRRLIGTKIKLRLLKETISDAEIWPGLICLHFTADCLQSSVYCISKCHFYNSKSIYKNVFREVKCLSLYCPFALHFIKEVGKSNWKLYLKILLWSKCLNVRSFALM